MRHINPILPAGHSRPIGHYSPGTSVRLAPGDQLLFISGQVATDATGAVLCPGDPTGQSEVVFSRIAAILAEEGGDLSDLISVTIFLSDRSLFPMVSAVRDRTFAEHAPASTLVIAQMMEEGCLLEINAIGVKRATNPMGEVGVGT